MAQCIVRITVFLLLCIALAAQAAEQHNVLRMEVTGVTDPIHKNIMTALENFRNQLNYPLTSADVTHFYEKAPQLIQDAIAPFGYFKPVIRSHLTRTDQSWNTQFHVDTGRPMIITDMQVKVIGIGQTDKDFQALLSQLPLKKGDILRTPVYENIKTALYNIAIRHGYFDAKMLKSQIVINLLQYQAKITLVFQTGPRYRFGDTTFSKTTFDPRFLARFLRYSKGEEYNAKTLEKTQEGLISSNFFSQVMMRPQPKLAKDGYVPIHIALMPRKPRQYTLGLGYGTDTHFRGTAGIVIRQLGHWGHRFQTLLRGSENNSSVVARYLIPGPNPGRDTFSIETGLSNISQATGSARNQHASFAYTLSSGHWKNTASLTYLNERYSITTLPRTSTELVYPALEFNYLSADHPMNPDQGVSMIIDMSGAGKKILSRTNFFQTMLNFKSLYTIMETKTRLLFRSELGYTNISNLAQLPLSLQLFAGGAQSVRGYGYNSLGPGRNLVVASTEVQQRVFDSLYVAGFCDAGMIGNREVFQHVNLGVGPAVAWVTPVGTLELSVANAVTQRTKPWSIEFTMGAIL